MLKLASIMWEREQVARSSLFFLDQWSALRGHHLECFQFNLVELLRCCCTLRRRQLSLLSLILLRAVSLQSQLIRPISFFERIYRRVHFSFYFTIKQQLVMKPNRKWSFFKALLLLYVGTNYDLLEMQTDFFLTQSHAGKVVLRSWYERNKHIFPASRWEPYDPEKKWEKYTVRTGFSGCPWRFFFWEGGVGEWWRGRVVIEEGCLWSVFLGGRVVRKGVSPSSSPLPNGNSIKAKIWFCQTS